MEIAMRILGTFTPAFLSFGPIFIFFSGQAKSQTTKSTIYGLGGAVALGLGLLYLFLMVQSLKNELDELIVTIN